jgi:hypothetical protein
MAHKLYFDNVATRSATLTDGKILNNTESDSYAFSSSATLTNEARAIDRNFTDAITSFNTGTHSELGFPNNDALQFNLGSAKSVDFMALYFSSAETDSIRIHADDSATGNTTTKHVFTSDFSAGWNICSFTEASYQYWLLEVTSNTLDNLTEVFLGLSFDVKTLDINVTKPFNTVIASTYNNIEFSNKIDTEVSTWTINIPLITEADKTSLELLQSDYSNLYTFVYYDDSNYYNVRLVNAITFNQVATNTYSATLILQEESSS